MGAVWHLQRPGLETRQKRASSAQSGGGPPSPGTHTMRGVSARHARADRPGALGGRGFSVFLIPSGGHAWLSLSGPQSLTLLTYTILTTPRTGMFTKICVQQGHGWDGRSGLGCRCHLSSKFPLSLSGALEAPEGWAGAKTGTGVVSEGRGRGFHIPSFLSSVYPFSSQ